MFWTAGWAAILGFSSGLVGIGAATVTAILSQRSTTNREFMLADRAWNEKLFVAQRDVISEFILFSAEFTQPALESIVESMEVVVANYMSDAQVNSSRR